MQNKTNVRACKTDLNDLTSAASLYLSFLSVQMSITLQRSQVQSMDHKRQDPSYWRNVIREYIAPLRDSRAQRCIMRNIYIHASNYVPLSPHSRLITGESNNPSYTLLIAKPPHANSRQVSQTVRHTDSTTFQPSPRQNGGYPPMSNILTRHII